MTSSVACLLTLVLAQAQEIAPPPLPPSPVSEPLPAPPPPPAPSPPPLVAPATVTEQPAGPSAAKRPTRVRARRFLESPGGFGVAVTVSEFLLGGTAGGIIGARLGTSTPASVGAALLGIPVGGVAFWLGSQAFFFFAPDNVGQLAFLMGTATALATLGVGVKLGWDGWTAVLGMTLGFQVGLALLLLATLPVQEVSESTNATVRMLTGNTVFAGALTVWLLASLGNTVDPVLMLFAPLAGMALGGLLAAFVDVSEVRANAMFLGPIFASAFVGLIVSFVMTDGFKRGLTSVGPAPAIATLGTFGVSVLATAIFDWWPKPAGNGPVVRAAPALLPGVRAGAPAAFGAVMTGEF